MPILASLGAASARAFGLNAGAAVATVDYLVIAGGGAGGGQRGQGGGAGGARTSFPGGTQIEVGIGEPITVTVGSPSLTESLIAVSKAALVFTKVIRKLHQHGTNILVRLSMFVCLLS